MSRIQRDQSGFSAIEGVLVLVIVVAIGFVGWYVLSAQKNTNKVLSSNSSSTTKTTGSTTVPESSNSPGSKDNQALQSDLSDISSTSSQSNQDLNSSTTALSDKSTFTAVPQ